MNESGNKFFLPSTLAEFFADWAKAPEAEPFACDALQLAKQNGQRIVIPDSYISLDFIDELKKITRTERYLEIGSKTTLHDILNIGRAVPQILCEVLEGAASPFLQPLISLGACVHPKSLHSEIAAALSALDARYELRTSPAQGAWISAARYAALAEDGGSQARELLTRVRVPLDDWDYSIYRKLRRIDDAGGGSMTALVLTKIQKDILTGIRVVLAAGTVLRDMGAENYLLGKHLPLDEKDALHFTGLWEEYLEGIEALTPMQRDIAVNCLADGLRHFVD